MDYLYLTTTCTVSVPPTTAIYRSLYMPNRKPFVDAYFSTDHAYKRCALHASTGRPTYRYLFDRNTGYRMENELACYVIGAALACPVRVLWVKSVTNGESRVARTIAARYHVYIPCSLSRGWCIGVFASDRASQLAPTFARSPAGEYISYPNRTGKLFFFTSFHQPAPYSHRRNFPSRLTRCLRWL